MAVNYLGDNNPDGSVLGLSSTEKIGFYGIATPIVQPSVTGITTTALSQIATSGKYAFSSSTAGAAFVSAVRSIQDKLAALGLIAES